MKKIAVIVLAVIAIASLAIGTSILGGTSMEPGYVLAGGEKIKWIGQVDVGAEDPLFASVQRACQRITRASDGRLELTVEPAGAIVPRRTEFDGVHEGVIDFAVSLPGWWTDKFAAADLFASRHGGMSPKAKYLWFTSGGGVELAQQMIDAYDVRLVPGGVWLVPPEVFLHSRYPVNELADLVDLKLRAWGGAGEILSRMGAETFHITAEEIYAEMESGNIDAFEFSGPYTHWQMGLHEVADYVYVSGCRLPHWANLFIVNQTSWNELPNDLKRIVQRVSEKGAIRGYEKGCQLDIEFLAKFRDYGCAVEMLSPEIEEAFIKEAKAYHDELADEDPFYAEVLRSLRAFEAIQLYAEQCE